MSFEEIFAPGSGHAREQEALDKVRPATEIAAAAPKNEDEAGGIVIPDPTDLKPFE